MNRFIAKIDKLLQENNDKKIMHLLFKTIKCKNIKFINYLISIIVVYKPYLINRENKLPDGFIESTKSKKFDYLESDCSFLLIYECLKYKYSNKKRKYNKNEAEIIDSFINLEQIEDDYELIGSYLSCCYFRFKVDNALLILEYILQNKPSAIIGDKSGVFIDLKKVEDERTTLLDLRENVDRSNCFEDICYLNAFLTIEYKNK